MSIQSILNQNTLLQKNATSDNMAGSTACYITIPWVKTSTINRVFITAGQNITGLTVSIVKNGAKHLEELDPAIKASFIVAQKTGIDLVDGLAEVIFDNNYLEADACYIYLLITKATAFPVNTVFNISIEGKKRISNLISQEDSGIYLKTTGFRALLDSTIDITDQMRGSTDRFSGGVPIGHLLTVGNEIFLGSEQKMNRFEINRGAAPFGGTFGWSISYWDGATWVNPTKKFDNTYMNFYNGTLEFQENAGVAWKKLILPGDPLNVMSQNMLTGSQEPVFIPSSRPLYWVSFYATGDDVPMPRITPIK
jgi:hypothetical protein